MSNKDRQRLSWMGRVDRGEVTLKKACEWLGVSYRQAKRIRRRYGEAGAAGLVHRLRGRASGRARSGDFRVRVVARYQEAYPDFGPTLAAEHLSREGMVISGETLRRWLLAAGVWQRRRKRQQHRQWRARKEHGGELVQMDGSHHNWFEGRRDPAVLMVMVDDATNRTYARFFEEETTAAAFETFERYTHLYGLALALYIDRDSIYRTEREPGLEEQMRGAQPLTQFARAMQVLEVKMVFAYSPQAKGRVERTHGTLQDRLVKEMRLAGIETLERANAFLEEQFLADFNKRFMVPPATAVDLHRKARAATLKEALSWEEARYVGQDWTVRWENRWFQLSRENAVLELAGRQITVRRRLDGTLELLYGPRKLRYVELPQRPARRSATRSARAGQKEEGEEAFNKKKEKKRSPWRKFGGSAGRKFWSGIQEQRPEALKVLESSKRGHFKCGETGDILKEL